MRAAEGDAASVLSRRSELWVAMFTRIFRRTFLSDFRALRLSLSGTVPAPDTPHLVLYANHPSWWDPVAFLLLSDLLFKGRAGFAPIDARMLGQYGFFERIGVFGVDIVQRAGAARFREVASAVLADPSRILLVTAQGRFADVRERPVRLKTGIGHVADWCDGAVFVPLALDYVFWDERKPELLMRFGDPITATALRGLPTVERMAHLERALESCMDRLAVEGIARDPSAFKPLITGRSGVGGVYDLWRQARAKLTGKAFDAAHGGGPK